MTVEVISVDCSPAVEMKYQVKFAGGNSPAAEERG